MIQFVRLQDAAGVERIAGADEESKGAAHLR
jgi:hypothetical protein